MCTPLHHAANLFPLISYSCSNHAIYKHSLIFFKYLLVLWTFFQLHFYLLRICKQILNYLIRNRKKCNLFVKMVSSLYLVCLNWKLRTINSYQWVVNIKKNRDCTLIKKDFSKPSAVYSIMNFVKSMIKPIASCFVDIQLVFSRATWRWIYIQIIYCSKF